MKRLIVIVCFFYFQNSVASQPPQKLIRRNMLIFFDPKQSDGEQGALKTELHAAIKFTTNVIIVTSGHIFLNVLKLPPLFLGKSLEKFDVQIYESAGLVILIPKALKDDSGLNNFSSANTDQIAKNTYRDTKIANLEKLFVADNKKKYEWYIALNGHGLYGKRESMGSFQEDMIALYSGLGLGIIAGMALDDFQNFLHLLNDKINTKVLYFNSCYAGELNLGLAFSNLVQMRAGRWVLRPHIKPHYDIISGALTGAVTAVPGGQEQVIAQSSSAQAIEGLIDFQNFFIFAQRYFGDQKGSKRIDDKLLIDMCSQLDRWSAARAPARMIAQLPQIKFVHQDFFQVVPLNDNIFILDDVVVKRHMLGINAEADKPKIAIQKRTINLEKREYVLLYSTLIGVPVQLPAYIPQFVSMVTGPTVHVFDSIVGLINLPALVRSQMMVSNVVPKYYLVKRMGEYLNIIMHVQALPTMTYTDIDQIKDIFAYYFKQGNHYLSIFSKNANPIEVMIPGSERLDKKIQGVINGIQLLAEASLEKRVRELNDHFIKLLIILHEAGIAHNKKDPAVAMFLQALAHYSNARTTFDRANLFHRAFEGNIATADQKIIKEFNDLLQENLTHISYPRLQNMFNDLAQRAHAYLIQNPSNNEIQNIEKIAEGFSLASLQGKLAILSNSRAHNRHKALALQAGAIADRLIARDMYQKAIDRLAPFTPTTSAKIIKIYNAWINALKDSDQAMAQRLFQTATARAVQLENELKQFPSGVTPKFTQEKQQLVQFADFFKERPLPKEREKTESRDESAERAADQSEIRHRLVRQYNEELSEDPTIMPYDEVIELWDNIRDKARKYLGTFGSDEKISQIQTIAEGLGSVPTIEGKLAIKTSENANNYYRKVRDYEVKKANILVDQANYIRAIELLRPFTPDTSAKIIKIYIQMINYLAQQSRRSAREQAVEVLEAAKSLEREFNFFGGIPPQFKEAKAELEKLYTSLK